MLPPVSPLGSSRIAAAIRSVDDASRSVSDSASTRGPGEDPGAGLLYAREGGDPPARESEAVADGYVTPPPGARLTEAQCSHLRAVSGFPAMPELADFFTASFGPRWAVTGSVALRLHAARLGRTDVLQDRPAADVDVAFLGDPRSALGHALSAAGLDSPLRYDSQDTRSPTSFDFAAGMKVDVMPRDAERWGSVTDAIDIAGIPVMSLTGLARSKRLAVEAGRDAGAGSALERDTQDLALLRALHSADDAATRRSRSLASYARIGPGPFEVKP